MPRCRTTRALRRAPPERSRTAAWWWRTTATSRRKKARNEEKEYPGQFKIGRGSYLAEKDEQSIDISSIFTSGSWPVAKVLHEDISLGISPGGYLDIRVYHNDVNMGGRLANFHVDYPNLKIILDEDIFEEQTFDIAIYADMAYVNERLITSEKYEGRINVKSGIIPEE